MAAAGKEIPEEEVEGLGSSVLTVARVRGGEAHNLPSISILMEPKNLIFCLVLL